MVKNPLSPVEHSGGVGVNCEMFDLGLDQFIVRLRPVARLWITDLGGNRLDPCKADVSPLTNLIQRLLLSFRRTTQRKYSRIAFPGLFIRGLCWTGRPVLLRYCVSSLCYTLDWRVSD